MRAHLALGSNLGDRLANLQSALDGLVATDGVEVVAVSAVYETDPVGGPVQDDYLNAVVEVTTDLAPHDLLAVCQRLEQDVDTLSADDLAFELHEAGRGHDVHPVLRRK